ncbi:hypothetical protein HD554DRAFT_2179246 [Boletus coccyginus]|nr:hypothetical protein HD554DRAFT_2179246 [Boletus coccyginus]
MNTSYQMDDDVLVATARIQAALEIVPRIVGPKKVWGPWMRDHLKVEEKKIPMASPSYPHPKLLGSLKGMLGNHHRNGMGVDTLLFDAVRADDPSVSGEEYVDVPSGSFPKVNGADLWWQDLPPEVSLQVDTPPTVPSQVEGQSSNAPVQGSSGLKLKLKRAQSSVAARETAVRTDGGELILAEFDVHDATLDGNVALTVTTGPAASQGPSHAYNGSESMGPAGGRNGNTRAPEDEGSGLREKKRKKFKSREFVDTDEDEDDVRVGPSKRSGTKRKVRVVSPEASGDLEGVGSRVCDACKTRGSECSWISSAKNSKRACQACVSAKTRCQVEGLPAIRRPRGKTALAHEAASKPAIDREEWRDKMDARMTSLEKANSTFASQISDLRIELRRLKQEKPRR